MRSHRGRWIRRKSGVSAEPMAAAPRNWRRKAIARIALIRPLHDTSYSTVRFGWVTSWYGVELVQRPTGWVLRIGNPPSGTPEFVSRSGYISEVHEASTPDFWVRVAGFAWWPWEVQVPWVELIRRLERNA